MNDKLLELLNKALSNEYKAANQYLHHYNNVRSKFSDITDHFKEHMADEQDHSTRLVNRIYILGGTPTIRINPTAEITDDVDEALKQDIIGEQEAIDLYTVIIKYCEEIGDIATKIMIEDILTDEVGHIDEFAKFRKSTVIRK